jgi:predicted RNA-binding protein with PIN domain
VIAYEWGAVRHIIVDGYNVIRANPRLQSMERLSLERARDVLVQTLCSAPRLSNDRITVVFDGALGTRSHVHKERVGRLLIVYSARGQKADDVIVEEARRGPAEDTVVVTNDVEVRENCRAAGCRVSGSENLLDQLPGAASRSPAPDYENGSVRSLSTVKRGNARRSSKRKKEQRDVRF